MELSEAQKKGLFRFVPPINRGVCSRAIAAVSVQDNAVGEDGQGVIVYDGSALTMLTAGSALNKTDTAESRAQSFVRSSTGLHGACCSARSG